MASKDKKNTKESTEKSKTDRGEVIGKKKSRGLSSWGRNNEKQKRIENVENNGGKVKKNRREGKEDKEKMGAGTLAQVQL